MTKARRQIQEKLKLIDAVIELIDARLPLSSRNPMIDEILQGKPRLVIMNKADLADPEVTRQWQAYFKEDGLTAFPVDTSTGTGVKDIPNLIKLLL
jgi:ribosome biogenesis GTPase A